VDSGASFGAAVSTALFLLGLSLALGIGADVMLGVPVGRQERLALAEVRWRQRASRGTRPIKQSSARLLLAVVVLGGGFAALIVAALVWAASFIEGALS